MGVTELDPRRAFRAMNLNDVVFDPDIVDPQTELNFVVSLPPGVDARSANVRGQVAGGTHDLLVWSRPDFGGTDSLGLRTSGGSGLCR